MATEPLPPSLQAYKPTQQEKQAYSYLFNKADNDQLGVLTGDLAVPFFSHSSLPPLILGEVWQLADPENSGFLTPERFGVACRLIGHAQEKKKTGAPEVREEWVGMAGPLPTFSNHPLPSHLQQQQTPAAATPIPTSPPPASRLQPQSTGNALLTTISPEDKAKYARVFAGANGGKLTGLVDGEKARDIFIKSNLPYEVLGQVWTLADTHSRGALDLPDFLIGLHLVHLLMDNKISPGQLPAVLDPRLYAAAAGLPPPGQGQQGQQGQQPGTPQRQSSLAPPAPPPAAPVQPPQQAPSGWAVSPQEKAESDQWFDQLDSAKTGRLEGEVAVGFFGQSGLEVGRLARVWDLSDLTSLGYLTKDTFAIAMHLLKSAVANPSAPLPETLPAELVPPSFRSQAPSGPSGAQRDLLDLMGDDDAPSSSSSAPVPALQPQPTGSASRPLSPQVTGRPTSPPVVPPGTARAISPQPTGSQAYSLQGTIFPQATGGSSSGAGGFGGNFAPSSASSPAPPPLPTHSTPVSAPAPAPAQTSNTFFDDNDDSDLASSASALSHHASQLRGTAREAEEKVEKEGKTRAQLEREVERLNEEVGELQGRITAAREAHDREVERVEDLRRREKEGKDNLARARQALIAAESDLSALRLSKTELEGEILRDKEDLREIQRRVAHVEEEKRVLEGEVEKLRKEVRGGKGRGAIARKQLSSVEAGRGALEGELQRLQSGGLGGEEEAGEEGQVPAAAAAAVPLPATPSAASVLSPAASVRSTNPFDRLTQQQTAVSPQPTGGSTASTNPFAFASSPTATSPTAASPAPFSAPPPPPPAADQSRSEQEQPASPSSLPYAAAAALGTGAVAALSAGAGVVAHALGVDGGDEGEGEKEGAKEGETDPFGVPVAAGSSSSSAAAAATATAEGGDGFEDAFSAAPPSAQQGDAAAFDDAFADFPPSSSSTSTAAPAPAAADAPVEGTLGEVDPHAGFDDAFRDLTHAEGEGRAGKDAVEGTLGEVDEGAGFKEAFREVEEHHQPQSHAAKEQDEEEDDSSDDDDDDEGPEDVFSSSRTSASRFERSPSPSPSPNVGVEPIRAAEEDLARGSGVGEEVEGVKSREPTNTSSESGGEESFVHVDAPVVSPTTATSLAATTTEDDLPPPGAGSVLEGTSHGVFNPIVGPAGTEESKGMLEDPAPVGFEPASPALSPSPSPAPPAALESPTEEKKEKRRAAPPPPTSRWPASTTSVPTPTAAAVDQGGFAAARPVEAVTAEDDFESAFADMGTSSSSTAPQAATATADFDDDAFDFKPDFADSLPSTTGTGTTTTSTTGGAGDGFDDAAFADFDSSFPAAGGAGAAPAQPSSSSAAFDDAFASLPSSSAPTAGSAEPFAQPGAPLTLGAPIASSAAAATSPFDTDAAADAPALPARGGPLPPTPKDEQVEIPRTAAVGKEGEEVDEVGAVGNLTALGFGREQAVEALQKYDYNLERAANYLVSQAAQ